MTYHLQGCPRCRGAVIAQAEDRWCIFCGWSGPTSRNVPLEPEGMVSVSFYDEASKRRIKERVYMGRKLLRNRLGPKRRRAS